MVLEYVVIKHGSGKYEPCHRPRTNTPCEACDVLISADYRLPTQEWNKRFKCPGFVSSFCSN